METDTEGMVADARRRLDELEADVDRIATEEDGRELVDALATIAANAGGIVAFRTHDAPDDEPDEFMFEPVIATFRAGEAADPADAGKVVSLTLGGEVYLFKADEFAQLTNRKDEGNGND